MPLFVQCCTSIYCSGVSRISQRGRPKGRPKGAKLSYPCYHVAAQWKNTGNNKPKGGSWANGLPLNMPPILFYSWNGIHNYLAMYTMYVMCCF